MLRIFRILKIAHFSRAMRRFARAFTLAREELILFVCATVLVLFASAVGVYYFENEAQPEDFASVFHALWWALETLTTIGYGDVMPITLGGRVFTFIMAICGLGVVAMPASIMAAALGRADREMDNR